MKTKHLDGAIEDHLVTADGRATLRHGLADIAGADRAVELTGVSSLPNDHDACAIQLLRYGLGLSTPLQIVRFELRALLLENGEVLLVGSERLALRQQIVACEAGANLNDVAHLAEILDTLEQDHFHFSILLVT